MQDKIKIILLSIVLVVIMILVCIIDRAKMILLICPVIAGCLCLYANYKEKIEFNTAVDCFLCSIAFVLFIYLRIILNFWVS